MFDDETRVTIDGTTFRYWTEIRITRAIDNIDSVECAAPFDPNDKSQRAIFQPISYKPFNVAINEDPFFTGVMVPCIPTVTPTSSTVSMGAYSLPGVLGDCPAPASELPTVYEGQNLQSIAEQLAGSLGINVYFRGNPGPVFDKVARAPDKQILPFLVELAKQRNFVISSTPSGALLFWQAIAGGEPVAILTEGASPLVSIKPTFNPQSYFSEITGLRPVRTRAKKSVQFTVRNTLLPDVVRPHVFEVSDGKDGDVQAAVRGKVGRMYANMVAYEATVATWRDSQGNLWRPNTIVRVTAHSAMVYMPFDMVIRSVVFRRGPKSETATLQLMLPGSFTGDQPRGLPWVE